MRRVLLIMTVTMEAMAMHGGTPDLRRVIEHVREAVQPDRAMGVMGEIYASDRWFTFPTFERTDEYLRAKMTEAGLADVELVHAPADGVTQVGFWTMPLAWDAESARLEILDDSVPAAERVLADYKQIPASLGMWSGPTPPEGVVAEIVHVKTGEAGRVDLRGKIALTDENAWQIKWKLVKDGAIGAINAFTESPSLEDGRQWVNGWGDNGWAFTKQSTPLLLFSITPRQTALLCRLLAHGPVRVKATVATRYYEGTYPYVTGAIRGTGSEEVLVLGHASEQGAQDNATGVAAILEALHALNQLIESGALPRPKRSMRALSMGEVYGSMHYVAHNPDRIRRTVAAICVDTPAAAYELAGTEFSFYMNPHIAKDFTDALILKIAADYFPTVKRPWHEKPFMTGTDTYLAEPMVGVPTAWGYSGSGVETHHNSEDTPDRADARSLRDITIVTAAFLYYVANAGEPEAKWLAGLSESRAYEQVLKAAAPFLDSGEHTAQRLEQAREALEYAQDRETQSILSVMRLVPEDRRNHLRLELQTAIDRLGVFTQSQFARIRAAFGGIDPAERPAPDWPAQTVVKRKRFGTIPLDDLPHDQWEGQPSGAWAAVPTLALYWCDGHRTLAEVERLTKLELGPTDLDFAAYFRFLRKHGYVDFVEGE